MSEKKKIYKPKPITGFPEWLPEERMVEQRWFDTIRRIFESYGYGSIETPSVEELEVISAKGEVDKEIYVLDRLHKEDDDKSPARLAMHFDQTVPFARYVAQHFNDLTFPFKRYQMQRVWRGERPQMGRMREFYQCDIDVINVDNLPIHFDAEVASIVYETLEALDIGRVQLRISNRKILMGLCSALTLDIEDAGNAIRVIDKLDKVGIDETSKALINDANLNSVHSGLIIQLISEFNRENFTKISSDYLENLSNFIQNEKGLDQMREGIEELSFVLDQLSHLPAHAVVADLSIVRGLDYYTGTVYETQLLDVPEFTGSVCSGGRYDDLAGQYINKHLPGVGISIGFSRLFDVLRQTNPEKLGIGPKGPADILVTLPSEEMRAAASETARQLRSRGMKVELYHAPQKIKKQLSYAEKKGIGYVWFPPFEEGQNHEIKNMQSGEQVSANPSDWTIDT